jgi:transposase
MPKSYAVPACDAETLAELQRRARSQTEAQRVVERARLILGCLEGRPMKEIAATLGVRANTAIFWRQRFAQAGLQGLEDEPRAGRPARYGAAFRQRVLATLEEPPPAGQAQWDGASVAARLGSSADAVWRVLRREGIALQRRRSWCVSTDPQFAAKAADIVGLYLHPPENALVLCLDEKPSMQALERRQGYVRTTNGKIVRGYKSTYRRHGTLTLFAALEVATGAIRAQFTQRKRRLEFLAFMEELVADFPPAQELHVIMDNYGIHKKNEAWLAAHPTVHFHFTPTSASWLNMVEIWFGLMERKALRNGDFHSTDELRQAIEAFLAEWHHRAHPFIWRKREVKGAQLRNTIVNLCN